MRNVQLHFSAVARVANVKAPFRTATRNSSSLLKSPQNYYASTRAYYHSPRIPVTHCEILRFIVYKIRDKSV